VAEAVRRAGIEPQQVDEIVMGNVVQAGWDKIARGRQASTVDCIPGSRR
jgi:acetyl-CoA acetyltransferase